MITASMSMTIYSPGQHLTRYLNKYTLSFYFKIKKIQGFIDRYTDEPLNGYKSLYYELLFYVRSGRPIKEPLSRRNGTGEVGSPPREVDLVLLPDPQIEDVLYVLIQGEHAGFVNRVSC